MSDLARRSDPLYEMRAEPAKDGLNLTGYAATFNRIDSYGTAFAPGAFDKTISERRDHIRILYQHNPEINFGVLNDITTDERGLLIDATILDDGADGTTFIRRVRGGVKFGLSFGFRTIQDRAITEDDQVDAAQAGEAMAWDGFRIITEVKLYEASPVTFSANEKAEILTIRAQARADALTSIFDDLDNNRLTDDERALLARIAAALPEHAPDGTAAPRTREMARRWDAEAALARIRYLSPDYLTG